MVKGVKAFKKGLVCRGFQFEENTEFKLEGAPETCRKGFHLCENPLDVLEYYPLIDDNGNIVELAEVEALGDIDRDGNKIATNHIRIGAKLNLSGFIKASFDFLWHKIKSDPSEPDSGDSAQLASSGDSAQLASSGDSAQLASSGHYAKLASSGDSAKLALEGADSVGAAIGVANRIKGQIGCWITLAEWRYDYNKSRYVPVCVKSAQVDGELIMPDTFYELRDGEFVAVDANG